MPDQTHDIVDTAVAAGSFKTLVAAVTAADLVDTLKGAGPFTVFAPGDDAFAALPAGTVEDLVKPENKDKLTKILLLHVVPGKVMAADLSGKRTVRRRPAATCWTSMERMVSRSTVRTSCRRTLHAAMASST